MAKIDERTGRERAAPVRCVGLLPHGRFRQPASTLSAKNKGEDRSSPLLVLGFTC